MGKIKRTEWLWVAVFAVAVMVFTSIPYWVAETHQTETWRFSGFVFGVEDGNSYIAKMLTGAQGAWVYRLVYSSEPQTGIFAYIFYLLLGKLAWPQASAAAMHTQLVMLFHLARWVGGLAWLATAYAVLAEFLPFPRQRQLGLVLVAFGGGLGWVIVLATGGGEWLGALPVDTISPEAFSFLALWGLPHLTLAYALMFLGWLAYWRQRAVWAGLAFLGMTLLQPIYGPPVWVLLGLDWLWDVARGPLHLAPLRERQVGGPPRWRQALITGLISAPIILYSLAAVGADPVLQQWASQNDLRTPHVLHYVAAYGLWLVPAALGWRFLRRRVPALARFGALWLLAAPVLIYLPFSIQRRFLAGVQLPLVAFTVVGLTVAWQRWRRWVVPLFVTATSLTTLLLWVGILFAVLQPTEPLFHLADQTRAFNRLGEIAQPGEVVLSAFETGNVLPAYVPLVAYLGHGVETAFAAQKTGQVAAFYTARTPTAERLQLLASGGVRWVIFGPHERTLGDFDPTTADYLRLAFVEGRYTVYEVAP